MAPANRINLIEEFEKQASNNYILLTTYNFTPAFFDTYLLDYIEKDNPQAEIFLLIDAVAYQENYAEFTRRTGTDYHLIPANLDNGIFHPKVFMFISEEEERACAYVCSSNLTLQGLTNNLETAVKLDYDLDDGLPKSINTIIEFFEQNSTKLTQDEEYQSYIENILNSSIADKPAIPETDVQLVSNHETSLLDQVITAVSGQEFDRVILSAPFVSENPAVVETILDAIPLGQVVLLLQRGNHNMTDIERYKACCDKHSVNFELREVLADESRFLHAKTILFDGDEQVALTGSANMTMAALQETWATGNAECGVILRGSDLDLLAEFEQEVITDEAEFMTEQITDTRSTEAATLTIHTARFEQLKNQLVVKAETRAGRGKLFIETRDPATEITRTIDLSDDEHTIDLDEGVPIQVGIKYDGEIGRRRVFYDDKQYLKRASRTSVSLDEVSGSFDEKDSIDIHDLVAVFQSIGTAIPADSDDRTPSSNTEATRGEGGETRGNGGNDGFRPPSRGSGGGGIDSLLKQLTDAYQNVRAQRERARQRKKGSSSGTDETDLTTEPTSQPEIETLDRDRATKQTKELIGKSNSLLAEKADTSENPMESWFDAQHWLVLSFLMFFGVLETSEEGFDYLEEQLEDNLQSFDEIIESDVTIPADIKRRFFTYVLIYNLVNRSVGREEFVPSVSVMRHFYSYDELIDRETYYAVCDRTESFVETNLNDISFTKERFRETYIDLALMSFNPRSFVDDICTVCEDMAEETDSEFAKFQAEFVRANAKKREIHRKVTRRVREIEQIEREEAEGAIEYLLDAKRGGRI